MNNYEQLVEDFKKMSREELLKYKTAGSHVRIASWVIGVLAMLGILYSTNILMLALYVVGVAIVGHISVTADNLLTVIKEELKKREKS